MRFLLLLSALLSAMVGSGAYARPALAQTHQAAGLGGVSTPKVAEAAQARRPVTELPRIVDRLGRDAPNQQAEPAAVSPIYASRFHTFIINISSNFQRYTGCKLYNMNIFYSNKWRVL